MVQSHIITRVTDKNLLREHSWYQCDHCGHKFEHYAEMFVQKPVTCPQCQTERKRDKLDILD